MFKTTDRINAIVSSYVGALKVKGFSVDNVYLFGSQARGTANPGSDIDLIVVSPEFSGMPMWKRWEVLGDALAEVLEPIEVIGYSPEEFQMQSNKQASFLRHILQQSETTSLNL